MVKARRAGAQHGHAAQIVNAGDIRLRGCSPRVGANPTMTDKITIQGVDTICFLHTADCVGSFVLDGVNVWRKD